MITSIHRRTAFRFWAIAILAIGLATTFSRPAATEPLKFTIAAGNAADTLKQFSRQASLQTLFDYNLVKELKTRAVEGHLEPDVALAQMLEGTTLTFERVNARTIAIREIERTSLVAQAEAVRLAQNEGHDSGIGHVGSGEGNRERVSEGQASGRDNSATTAAAGKEEDEEDPERGGIPEILVTGSKLGTLNTDIRRTENDIQPYVIFDRERLARSSASNLEEFFRNELTMGTNVLTAGQVETVGNRSRISLRGLGSDETLILIDGRRVAGFNFQGVPQQSDINGIPLAAIERIEVLPTTASGIFGGGATGGAINIVLRRDYAGLSTQLTYGNTFESDARTRRLDLSGGFNFDGGKTSVLVAGTYSDANPLLLRERNFLQRGRTHIVDNNGGNPQALDQFGFMPPLGATPNIRSLSGNLVLDAEFGGTNLGSPITSVPYGYAGAVANGGAALVSNAGNYNLDLADTTQQGGGRYSLLSTPEVMSLIMTVRREVTDRVQLFAELQGSETSTKYSANFADFTVFLPGSTPNNPFDQTIIVRVPTVGMDETLSSESESRRAVAGVITQLPGKWQAAVDYTWSRSRSSYVWPPGLSSTVIDAASTGSLDVLRDVNQYPVAWERDDASSQSPGDMTLKNPAVRLAGPLPWKLAGGSPILSTLFEYRDELLDEVVVRCIECGGRASLYPARSQSVASAYLEARVPFVSATNRMPALELLELQVAVRRDDYSVTGAPSINLAAPGPIDRFKNKNSSIDPTIGLRYQPLSDVTIRASFGTGYLPPSMTQLVPQPAFPSNLGFTGVTDPLRGNEPVGEIQLTQGGNPDLRPEESESWSIGMILTPRVVHGLRIAVDWNEINKIDNIAFPSYRDQTGFDALINFFPERIIREETGDGSVGRIIGLNATLINIADTRIEAVDFALDYELASNRAGTFNVSADATRLLNLELKAAPRAPVIQHAGTTTSTGEGALKWRASAALDWTYREWALGWRTRFFDSYVFDPQHTINASQGAAGVSSQTYHDLYGSYRFAGASASTLSILDDLEIRFGLNNVLNKEPPIDVVSSTLTMYSQFGDPRLASYYVAFRKSFGQ